MSDEVDTVAWAIAQAIEPDLTREDYERDMITDPEMWQRFRAGIAAGIAALDRARNSKATGEAP